MPITDTVATLNISTGPITATVPERRGRALLGWIQEPDVRPVFHASSVTSPASVEDSWRPGRPSTL